MSSLIATMWLGAALATQTATSTPSMDSTPPRLDVYPRRVSLTSANDQQRWIAVVTSADGVTRDVTQEVTVEIDDSGMVQQEGNRLIPLADAGETQLRVSWKGQETAVPLSIQGGTHRPPVSFLLDVMPTLTRAGCNTGTCHGASRGKDGFRLSLFGFDPQGDYHRLTRELATRRLNLAEPGESLLLEKAVGAVTHTGGKRFDVDSPEYRTLYEWMSAGAANDPEVPPTVDRITLFPPEVVASVGQTPQPLVVMAHYSDGTDRDVTDLAVFLSSDESVAPMSSSAVSPQSRGESFVTARYDTHTVGIPTIVLAETSTTTPSVAPVRDHYVDQLVADKLRKLRIVASPPCSDREFLRRIHLDVTGQLPPEASYADFMADATLDKRERMVDHLLARDEFADLWAAKWADLLMIRRVNNIMSEKGVDVYAAWLRDQIRQQRPFDEIVRELLTANGHSFSHPPANYYSIEPDRLKVAENTAQVFLGIRTQCAQCHNHPFDRWTMDDYYGFAAFFARVSRKRHEDYRQWIVFTGGGETRHPVSGKNVPPKYLGGPAAELSSGQTRREAVADWLVSPENPYFAKNLANRVWEHFFGRGIVEPVDDVRVSNPPSNGPLLDALAARLIETDYDIRSLARDILISDAYQRSSEPLPENAHDERNFARATVRRIPAPVLMDCLSQVTAAPTKFRRRPLGTKAVETPDNEPNNYFLKTFGRASRESACACESQATPTLSQALHLLNGDTVHEKIKRGGVVRQWLSRDSSPEAIVRDLYVRCLCRTPTDGELQTLLEEIDLDEPQQDLEDVFWAILNSREFLFIR